MTISDDNHLHESCGVVGVYLPGEDAARVIFYSLFALQHRGQESAGIAVIDGDTIKSHTGMGLVSQVFHEENLLNLTGNSGIGHTRYSTTGSNRPENCQPFIVNGVNGELALGHNGNVINAKELRERLATWGCEFRTSTDSEVIAYLLANAPGNSWEDRAFYCMGNLQGAYSLTILTHDSLLAIRDPLGVRPLCIGRLGNGWVIASESCALDHVGAEYVREVEPGEIVRIDKEGLHASQWQGVERHALCIFEHIYFSRPDSLLRGHLTYTIRQKMGAQLAREHGIDADLVTGIPNSATAAAHGYAQESGIPYADTLLTNQYVGRTFIQPSQHFRDLGVRMKFNPLPEVVQGKRLVVVDDSIVRGTTTPQIVAMLRNAGASEIHMRVCAPPIQHPCHFGVDMAKKHELLAAQKNLEEIRQFIDSDTLEFLSLDGAVRATGDGEESFCTACFSGRYPIPVQLELDKFALEN